MRSRKKSKTEANPGRSVGGFAYRLGNGNILKISSGLKIKVTFILKFYHATFQYVTKFTNSP